MPPVPSAHNQSLDRFFGPAPLGKSFFSVLALAALSHLVLGQIMLHFLGGTDPDNAYVNFTFRILASDANNWHMRGINLVRYWNGETDHLVRLMHPRYEGYVVILGALYYLVGSKIWVVQLLNATACFFSGAMAYKLGIYLGQPVRRVQVLTLLVVLWPQSLVLSAVTMRYSLWIFLIFGSLWSITALLNPRIRQGKTLALIGLGLFLICYFAVVIRDYLGIHIHLIILPVVLLAWLGPKSLRSKTLKIRVFWVYAVAVTGIVLAMQYPLGTLLPTDMRSKQVDERARHFSSAEAKNIQKPKTPSPETATVKDKAGSKAVKKPEKAKQQKAVDSANQEKAIKSAPSAQTAAQLKALEEATALEKKRRREARKALREKRKVRQKQLEAESSLLERSWDFIITNTWGRLMFERWCYTVTGGKSQSPEARVLFEKHQKTRQVFIPYGISDALVIIKAGLRDFLFFPFPWQAWPSSESWLRFPLALNTLFWYALLPGLFWGIISAARRNVICAAPALTWIILVGFVLAVVVVNLGTLYRFRDAVYLPWLLFFDPAPYVLVWKRVVRQGKSKS